MHIQYTYNSIRVMQPYAYKPLDGRKEACILQSRTNGQSRSGRAARARLLGASVHLRHGGGGGGAGGTGFAVARRPDVACASPFFVRVVAGGLGRIENWLALSWLQGTYNHKVVTTRAKLASQAVQVWWLPASFPLKEGFLSHGHWASDGWFSTPFWLFSISQFPFGWAMIKGNMYGCPCHFASAPTTRIPKPSVIFCDVPGFRGQEQADEGPEGC